MSQLLGLKHHKDGREIYPYLAKIIAIHDIGTKIIKICLKLNNGIQSRVIV